MPRARNIKPSFFVNDRIVELPFEDRLLFIGLWTLADREGRLEMRPKKIKLQIFPADDVDVSRGISRLAAAGLVDTYEVDGIPVLSIPKFVEHQRPHPKEAKSSLPPKPAPVLEPCNFTGNLEIPELSRLNPSSLNPESPLPPYSGGAPAPAREADEPTPAGMACIAMRAHGVAAVNPSHPELLALLAGGVTVQNFGDLAAELRESRGSAPTFPYLLATMRGRCEDAAAKPVTGPPRSAGNANSQWMASLTPRRPEDTTRDDHDTIDVPARRLG